MRRKDNKDVIPRGRHRQTWEEITLKRNRIEKAERTNCLTGSIGSLAQNQSCDSWIRIHPVVQKQMLVSLKAHNHNKIPL